MSTANTIILMIQYCGLVNSILNNAGFVVVIPGMQRGTTLKTKQSYQQL